MPLENKMNESQWTSQKLLPALRRKMPDAVIVKLNDATTEGLPDFFVCLEGVTTFFEVKLKMPYFLPLQYETLRRLQRGYYIIWGSDEGILQHVLAPWVESLGFKHVSDAVIRSNVLLDFERLITQIYERCLQ